MGLEFVRSNNSRCPSFMVAGLMVMCLFLVCSWWSLSSQNFELLRQIDDLSQQLSVNGEELNLCSQEKATQNLKIQALKDGSTQQELQLSQMKVSSKDLREKLRKQEDQFDEVNKKVEVLETCRSDLDSLQKSCDSKDTNIELLRTEKSSLLSDVEQKDAKIKELEETISTLKKKDVNDYLNKPIAKLLEKKVKNAAEETKADGSDIDGGGVAFGSNHDAANRMDKNNVAAVKADMEPVVPETNERIEDPRESVMKTNK